MSFRTLTLHPPRELVSLCWESDWIVDWAGGGSRLCLDGRFREPASAPDADLGEGAGFDADAATATADGEFAVVFERTGTRGSLLRHGQLLRELSRDDYRADTYEFPVCLWSYRGRTLLAYCPDRYNRIEIVEAATGTRLTESSDRNPEDFFHSRLTPSPGGSRLSSAGSAWHPWDGVALFDVEGAITDPRTLDRLETPRFSMDVSFAETSTVTWLSETTIVVGSSAEVEDLDDEDRASVSGATRLTPRGLAVYDLEKAEYTVAHSLGYPPGTMMPVGVDHVVTFYDHPRLVDLRNGALAHAWPSLETGTQVSSILWGQRSPPIALDPANRRFAVATERGIVVVFV